MNAYVRVGPRARVLSWAAHLIENLYIASMYQGASGLTAGITIVSEQE